MTVRVDNHSHIMLRGIGDMVAAASAKGVTEYSVTEHVSQFRELRGSVRFGSLHSSGRIFESLNEYEMEFRKIDERYPAVKVSRGLEVDFAPRFESRVADFVNQREWDVLLCSVHEFGDATDVESSVGNTPHTKGSHERWRDYFRLERLALESKLVPFDVLAHPVRMSRGTVSFPPDIDGLLIDLATSARSKDKALELNGNDIDYAPGLVRKLAMACSKVGCKVSLGSDAHYPRQVFRNMDKAMGLVSEFNLELYQSKLRR